MAAVYHVEKIANEWYNVDQLDGGGRIRTNLHNLQLCVQPNSIKWTATAPTTTHQGPTRKVTVNNKTTGAEVFGNLQTSKESKMIVKVQLTTGLVQGLNKKMRLPLPPEVHDFLGESVEIDPSKSDSESGDVMTISMTSGHDIPAGASSGATATVNCKEGQYQGRFECIVELSGLIIFKEGNRAALQYEVFEVFRDLKQKDPDGCKDITIMEKHVEFKMEGHCQFCWDFEQTIDWQ